MIGGFVPHTGQLSSVICSRDNFAKPHTLSLAYKASTFFDHGDPYMNIFKYMKNNK